MPEHALFLEKSFKKFGHFLIGGNMYIFFRRS